MRYNLLAKYLRPETYTIIHQHRSTELAAIWRGKVNGGYMIKYDSNKRFSIETKNSTDLCITRPQRTKATEEHLKTKSRERNVDGGHQAKQPFTYKQCGRKCKRIGRGTTMREQQANQQVSSSHFLAWKLHWAALSYSARRYDSAVCCSKMSHDGFWVKHFMKQIKCLRVRCSVAGVCVFTRWRTEQTVNYKCMFYFVIWRKMSINGLHLCLRLLCKLLHCCKRLSKYVARPWSANLQWWGG